MSAPDDVELVRRVYDLVNRGDLEALEACFAPDMVRHELTDLIAHAEGSDSVTSFLDGLRAAIPDLHMELEDVFATGEGRVAARSTLTGTMKGAFLGQAPTGRRASFAAITLYRVKDGLIAEAWSLVDWAGALRQFGAQAR